MNVKKKVYQRIDDPKHGDCFKCCVCTLLGLSYDEVPNFIEYGDHWWVMMCKFFADKGYIIGEPSFTNPNVPALENPVAECFKNNDTPYNATLKALKNEYGVNGLFMASVYSPKYTNPNEHPIDHLHAVLCDVNFNIVFDPQKSYINIIKYPYADLIGYNGIRGIDTVRKATDMEEHAWRKLYYHVHSMGYYGVNQKTIDNTVRFLGAINEDGLRLPDVEDVTNEPYGTISIDYSDDNGNMLSMEIGKAKIGFFTDYADGTNDESDGIATDFKTIPEELKKHIENFSRNE